MTTVSHEMSSDQWAATGRLDVLGAVLSMLCLAHCMILPFLPLLLSILPWLGDEKLHLGLLLLIAPTSLFSFARGVRRHTRWFVFWWGCVALGVLLMGPVSGELLEKPLTVVGSVLLCVAHIQNRRHLFSRQ